MKIYLEGPDLIGKTTIKRYLEKFLDVEDRHDGFTKLIHFNGELNFDEITNVIRSITNNELIIVLFTNTDLLKRRKIYATDKFDKRADVYNSSYISLLNYLSSNKMSKRVMPICVDGLTTMDLIHLIVCKCLDYSTIDLNSPIIEGESKLFFAVKELPKICLVKLKPTLYSFTHNRYGIVEGTDLLRNNFWSLFGKKLNNSLIQFEIDNNNFISKVINNLSQQFIDSNKYTLLTDSIGLYSIDDVVYNIVIFDEEIPNIEIVWKQYLYGTMKHCLYDVDKFKTRNGINIEYEGAFPESIVRFDWRNKLPHKDECIPEDFANFYINVKNAKLTAKIASFLINSMLLESGFYLVDICYFMNQNGNQIKSEITPDGMRIHNLNHNSFDKDLWRNRKGDDELVESWKYLLNELQHNKSETISGIMYYK